ncbi:MAG TPA: aminopeptidase [Candidatus Acidoferrum sp.]|nr:aminopeptidase [Candidatus Acidoferrum sp.]
MVDQRVESLAKLCVHYSVDVKPKEKVVIRGSMAAAPLIAEIYKECLLSDAYPWVLLSMGIDYVFYKQAKDHQLTYVSPFDKFIYENMDVRISIFCDPNPKRLSNVDPSKMKTFNASQSELMKIFYNREARGSLRWTGLPFPISDQAQEAAMALGEYEDFVYNSCMVDKKDPASEWKRIHENQQKICDYLDTVENLHVVGEGTDLTLNCKGRKWINASGQKNMPDGEVFTGPIENSAQGEIRFTYPGVYMGREVEDIRLKFKDGRLVDASASKGEDLLKQLIKIEGADHIGEFAVGTNYGITRFTKSMLFDEKMGGTIHMALGNGYPDTGSRNNSAIHWDILKDMKKDSEIYADGTLFYKNGKFLI